MFWSLSLQFMPDETVLEDSGNQRTPGVKPMYSVFITNKRVIFRLDSLGSSMAQSFVYPEILDARPVTRMLIHYLALKTNGKEHFLHVPNPVYWSTKILDTKKNMPVTTRPGIHDAGRKRQDLQEMLVVLARHQILSQTELEEKKKMVDSIRL